MCVSAHAQAWMSGFLEEEADEHRGCRLHGYAEALAEAEVIDFARRVRTSREA